jgi:hypothetical protein
MDYTAQLEESVRADCNNIGYAAADFTNLRRLHSSPDSNQLHRVCAVLAVLKHSTLPPWRSLAYSDDSFMISWTRSIVLHVIPESSDDEEDEGDYAVQSFSPPAISLSSDHDTLLRHLAAVLV